MNQQLMMFEVKAYFPHAVYSFSSSLLDDSYMMSYYADFARCLQTAVALDH